MWKDFLAEITTSNIEDFDDPVSEGELLKTEKVLNIKLPESLKSLLRETDGINDIELWSIREIRENNISIRYSFKENFMPLDCFLFFIGAGNGDYFGYSIINGTIWKEDIYVWNHEDDSRKWVASSLKNFLKSWISGELSI